MKRDIFYIVIPVVLFAAAFFLLQPYIYTDWDISLILSIVFGAVVVISIFASLIIHRIIRITKFKLMNRRDILDYAKSQRSGKYKTIVDYRRDAVSSDSININDKNYATLYERDGVVKLVVRNDSSYINKIRKLHPSIEKTGRAEADWYDIVLDKTFTDNGQVRGIIKTSFKYTKQKLQSDRAGII